MCESFIIKKCIGKCGRELPEIDEFFYFKKSTGKFRNECRECVRVKQREIDGRYYKDKKNIILEKQKNSIKRKENQKQYYQKNKEKYKKYYEENKNEISIVKKEHYEEHKDVILNKNKQYRGKNKNKIKEGNKKYYNNNIEKIRKQRSLEETKQRRRNNENNRRKVDISWKIKHIVSAHIRAAIKQNNGYKNSSVWQILPYTPQQLKEHLEKQFEPWMTWENHGPASVEKRTWNIDHIIPQSLLTYDSLEHPNFLECWKLENLRPLDAIENIKKWNKIL